MFYGVIASNIRTQRIVSGLKDDFCANTIYSSFSNKTILMSLMLLSLMLLLKLLSH